MKRGLGAPLEWAYEGALYSWKLQLKQASDAAQMERLWAHFAQLLDAHLERSRHQLAMGADEAQDLFAQEWARSRRDIGLPSERGERNSGARAK